MAYITETTKRVQEYFAGSEELRIKAFSEVSPNAVAILDNHNDFNVYFDRDCYRVRNEEIWLDQKGTNIMLPSSLEKLNLGVLPGLSSLPSVKGFSDALAHAQENLAATKPESEWYETPRKIMSAPNDS